MTDDERLAWLRLARTEQVGPVAFENLLGRFGSARAAMDALPDLVQKAGRSGPLRIPTPDDARRELAAGDRMGARLLCAGEPAFPQLLAAVDPPPPLIWVLGDIGVASRPTVAIVGARIASAGGQKFARGLAAQLGEAGVTVISGLARGIDGAAHLGALPTGTIAVLGGGLDDIYPPEHSDLHRQIAERGAIVSESPPGYRAQARDFPRRNRLISGLSLAVVVVEAELRSGSLITARLANEQGREVLAVPGSPLDPRAKGTNDLIRQGAQMCESVDDVLTAIRDMTLRERDPPQWKGAAASDREIDALRERLADLLSPTSVSRDELVRATGAPVPVVLAALTELALAGRAELLPGGMVTQG
ncbi:MAG: DNA-protecting protein DprA [Caulobacteraceae bacterium]|nr:MAG: DNA-protecting protein DprA [Caulobacteraceae bacterium]